MCEFLCEKYKCVYLDTALGVHPRFLLCCDSPTSQLSRNIIYDMAHLYFTTVYFKVTSVPQTGRSSDTSPRRGLSVKIFKDDLLTSAPYLDSYGLSQLHMKLVIALGNEFPDCSKEAHQIVFMGK